MSRAALDKAIQALCEQALLKPGERSLLKEHIQPRLRTVAQLRWELEKRQWLTPFQLKYLKRGRIAHLRFGPYVLRETLGRGGMGVVFKARHVEDQRPAAIKILRKDRLTEPMALKRFQQEIRISAKLRHPNIVRAREAGYRQQRLYLVMEYVRGLDLTQIVERRGRLTPPQACECLRQAALALQHAHAQGLVHRDVKPSNFILTATRRGQVLKLLDLGLARCLAPRPLEESRITENGVLLGSVDFLSPEQAKNARDVDVRSDLYSLGCTFYYLLTGRPVFPGGTFMDKVMRHSLEAPPTVPYLCAPLQHVLAQLLAKRPEDRFASSEELLNELVPLMKHPDQLTRERHPAYLALTEHQMCLGAIG